jgi:mannitol 2-dehydrogenase
MATALSLKNLPAIAARAAVPAYDRRDLSSGIVHFGVGNFHRSHQAVYLDTLFNRGLGRDWALTGAGVMPGDTAMMKALAPQDWLTTVVEQEAGHSAARVTGAMCGFIPPGDTASLLMRLADPAIRIVSLTVTEGGYFIDPATQRFNPDHPAMKEDAANPSSPKTTFGLILAGLARRRAAGIAPFTVMSCDNIPHNGAVARNAVAGLAEASDKALAAWVRGNVAFPNGMVDRITPATTDRERGMLASDFGIADNWPVFCEDFSQWVLEDQFTAGRPPLEEAGIEFVSDVTPFEHMKIRILNGGHAAIAYPAGLLDVHFVHEAMEHPLVSAFLTKLETEEIIPTVPPVPKTDTGDYFRLIRRRFGNPKIADTIRRLCFDGSNRQPKFILPPARERVIAGLPVRGLALESALWCRYCAGTTDSGRVIEPNDPAWDRLADAARAARADPASWLGMADIYGDLAEAGAFAAAFGLALQSLWTRGTEATLRDYLADKL